MLATEVHPEGRGVTAPHRTSHIWLCKPAGIVSKDKGLLETKALLLKGTHIDSLTNLLFKLVQWPQREQCQTHTGKR